MQGKTLQRFNLSKVISEKSLGYAAEYGARENAV
jgi:hypothetical protein